MHTSHARVHPVAAVAAAHLFCSCFTSTSSDRVKMGAGTWEQLGRAVSAASLYRPLCFHTLPCPAGLSATPNGVWRCIRRRSPGQPEQLPVWPAATCTCLEELWFNSAAPQSSLSANDLGRPQPRLLACEGGHMRACAASTNLGGRRAAPSMSADALQSRWATTMYYSTQQQPHWLQ